MTTPASRISSDSVYGFRVEPYGKSPMGQSLSPAFTDAGSNGGPRLFIKSGIPVKAKLH